MESHLVHLVDLGNFFCTMHLQLLSNFPQYLNVFWIEPVRHSAVSLSAIIAVLSEIVLYPLSPRYCTIAFCMGVCRQFVLPMNNCLYSVAKPCFIAASVFVVNTKSVWYSLIQLLLGCALTIFQQRTHISRAIRIISEIDDGGVLCDSISSTFSIIGVVHASPDLVSFLEYLWISHGESSFCCN